MESKSAVASPAMKTVDIDNWVWAELPQLFETPVAFDGSLVLVYSHDGSVRWASDGILRLLGYSRLDFDRGAIDWDETTPPEYWSSRTDMPDSSSVARRRRYMSTSRN
jgi:hypothetical protein